MNVPITFDVDLNINSSNNEVQHIIDQIKLKCIIEGMKDEGIFYFAPVNRVCSTKVKVMLMLANANAFASDTFEIHVQPIIQLVIPSHLALHPIVESVSMGSTITISAKIKPFI